MANNNIGYDGAIAIRNAVRGNKECALVKLSLGDSKLKGYQYNGIAVEIEQEIKERAKTRFTNALNSDRKAPFNRVRLMFVGQGRAG
eukprot:CAMPEP_0204864870 /NCGR_PEP_ID=MMETSP1348-20121228/4390_1 /ASSEMBLY_ACC=CAM_ASM_000700 /TAXON_ID=215587 /ORGANISM="Aplanochytrium stocchinoi, Strain GSBS06" /LENGTH=86 /DNA_ID=CAMNT_0052015663 /DNA_START=355 /DNA_END=611 /DNA_ORIENTATION=+